MAAKVSLPLLSPLLLVSLLTPWAASAQEAARPVYRCPGPPVLYTDAISVEQARERGCRPITGAPLTVVQVPRRPAESGGGAQAPGRREPGSTGAASEGAPREAGEGGANRVDPALQRQRDAQARTILQSELAAGQAQLDALVKAYNGGQPERRGDERNAALYFDRVAQLKTAIERKQADLAALRRELAKLGN